MRLNSFSILLFTFVLLLLAPNLATAIYISEAAEIPYQVNNSDRIIIGTVSKVDMYSDYTIATITVSEWLYNPLPTKTIQVMTIVGLEDEAEFTQNESVLLMLKDKRPDKNMFLVFVGSLGKHPVSDRYAVIKELKDQGKWKGEDQTENKTNETEEVNNTEITSNQKENVTENKTVDNGKEGNTGTVDKQEEKSNTTKESNDTPFVSSFWILAIVLVTFIYVRKMK